MNTFDLQNPNPNHGYQLRDEAANLLSTRFGSIRRELRVSGKKADLYFEKRDFGKISRIYVEAKNYNRALRREEVVEIWADYFGIITNKQPAILIIVTKQGLTADAQSYIGEEIPNMRHQTIWDLENDALGLNDYIRALVDEFDQGGLSSYYVEARASRAGYHLNGQKRIVSDKDEIIFDEIMKWIDSGDFKPIAVLGGYGGGKTCLAKRVASYQAKQALSNPLARRPILIRLGVFTRYSSLEGILGGMFTHDFPVENFNVRSFLQVNSKGRLLIILDGFDEMKHAMSWADFRTQVQALNQLCGSKSKIILLGRPSAFISLDEHVYVLRGMKRFDEGWRKLPDWPEFYEFDLKEFSALERNMFIRGYLQSRGEIVNNSNVDSRWIEKRANELNDIAETEADLFNKPVHAKIITDLATDPTVDLAPFKSGISRWQLYEMFFSTLVERESEKEARRPIGESDRATFLRQIAFWLWTAKGGATSFDAADLPEIIFKRVAVGDSSDIESLKREYLSGSFLGKKTGDIYFFAHRSFAEYLVASYLLNNIPSHDNHIVYSNLMRDGVLVFLNECPNPQPVSRWLENIAEAKGTFRLE